MSGVADPRHVPEAWPALLSRDQLSAYIGVAPSTLVRVCPVAPVDLGANVIRYRRLDIDAWVAGLPPRLRARRKDDQDVAEPAATVPDVAVDEPEDRPMSAVERARARAAGGQACKKTAARSPSASSSGSAARAAG